MTTTNEFDDKSIGIPLEVETCIDELSSRFTGSIELLDAFQYNVAHKAVTEFTDLVKQLSQECLKIGQPLTSFSFTQKLRMKIFGAPRNKGLEFLLNSLWTMGQGRIQTENEKHKMVKNLKNLRSKLVECNEILAYLTYTPDAILVLTQGRWKNRCVHASTSLVLKCGYNKYRLAVMKKPQRSCAELDLMRLMAMLQHCLE